MPKIFHDPHKTPSTPAPTYLMYGALYIVKTVNMSFLNIMLYYYIVMLYYYAARLGLK